MKKITKSREPNTLTNYRSRIPKANRLDENIYNDFPDKRKEDCKINIPGNLRKQLLEEQGYICCYCMQRISCENSRIEHFKSQEHNRRFQIEYKNLFIACNNSEGESPAQQHCDVKKGDSELLRINLLSSHCINKIKYDNDCTIYSDDSVINAEINDILNLNIQIIKNSRRQALSNLISNIEVWNKAELNRLITKYSSKNCDGNYAEFSGMIVLHLQKKVRRYGA